MVIRNVPVSCKWSSVGSYQRRGALSVCEALREWCRVAITSVRLEIEASVAELTDEGDDGAIGRRRVGGPFNDEDVEERAALPKALSLCIERLIADVRERSLKGLHRIGEVCTGTKQHGPVMLVSN